MRAVSQRIDERIRSIVRADYDDLAQPDLPKPQLPVLTTFFRITGLARFWDHPQAGGESLAERQQQLITSLYGVRSPWTYVVLGEGGVACVFIGLPCRDGEVRSWGERIAAQLPGSTLRMERPSQQILATLMSFPMIAAMSGNPSIGTAADRQSGLAHHSPGVESLFEMMAGVRWAYMVLAQPLADVEVAADLHRTEAELLETNSAYRRRGSAEETNGPQVTRYLALLESARQKLVQGQRQGMWDVQSYLMVDTITDCERGTQALHAAFGGPGSEPQPLRVKMGSRDGVRSAGVPVTTRLNTSEVTVLASLPRREMAGLQVTEYVPFGMVGGVGGNSAIALGTLMSGGTCTSLWFEIQKESMNKHVFVAGVPGSGKTRTCLYLLSQLWKEHRVPWLVLEPSLKNEYRALLRSSIGADVRVLTAGDESVAPLRLNPLEVPNGVHVQTHIGGLATLFRAAFAMEAPLPYILDEAIHQVYEERGWDMVSGIHPSCGPECQPTLGDLLETCSRLVHSLGYDNQLKGNLQAALKTRISSLTRGAKGRMLNVRQSVSMEYLLSAPTVIEFSAIGDDDEKAFLLGCILLKLAQHRQIQGLTTTGLRHVTLIEEAHRLLRNVSDTAGTSVANPRRQAVEAFCNMLAELRAFGEGLVVVDQMPSKLVPDVIRNSGLKVVHRLTAEEERRIVGGAMSLDDGQIRFLASLPPGQAVVYSGGSSNACRVCIPDHAGREGYLRESPSQAEVKTHMQGRIPESVDPRIDAGAITPEASYGGVLRQCMSTCPASTCTTRVAVDGYASRHAGELEASFQRAMADGFGALWQFGGQVADRLWTAEERQGAGPFCVVMAIAGRIDMAKRDIRVLRENMARLRGNERQECTP